MFAQAASRKLVCSQVCLLYCLPYCFIDGLITWFVAQTEISNLQQHADKNFIMEYYFNYKQFQTMFTKYWPRKKSCVKYPLMSNKWQNYAYSCFSTGTQTNQHVLSERITFHSQRKNHLFLHLTEVDPFGNYSSPHYKGTAMFYKVTRGQLEWRGDKDFPLDPKLLGDPVCKLSLTLPKVPQTSQ